MRLSLSGFLLEGGGPSPSLGLPEFCALAKEAGYDGVELRRSQVNISTSQAARKDILALVKDSGLYVTCLTARGMPGSGCERDDFFRSYLRLCRSLECSLIKIGGGAEWLRWAADEAESAGVTLASNNHIGTALETVRGTTDHLQAVKHRNYGLLYDAMHLHAGQQAYLECIPAFLPATRNILVHVLRPARAESGSFLEDWERALTEAVPYAADWRAVLGTYRGLGYDGLVTLIENGWPVDEREGVARRAAEILRRLWEEA